MYPISLQSLPNQRQMRVWHLAGLKRVSGIENPLTLRLWVKFAKPDMAVVI